MKLEDKISLDAIKTQKDAILSENSTKLLNEKVSAYLSSGLESLISPVGSLFSEIQLLIGKFLTTITNSQDIIEDNKNLFFNRITEDFDGELPEDLK